MLVNSPFRALKKGRHILSKKARPNTSMQSRNTLIRSVRNGASLLCCLKSSPRFSSSYAAAAARTKLPANASLFRSRIKETTTPRRGSWQRVGDWMFPVESSSGKVKGGRDPIDDDADHDGGHKALSATSNMESNCIYAGEHLALFSPDPNPTVRGSSCQRKSHWSCDSGASFEVASAKRAKQRC